MVSVVDKLKAILREVIEAGEVERIDSVVDLINEEDSRLSLELKLGDMILARERKLLKKSPFLRSRAGAVIAEAEERQDERRSARLTIANLLKWAEEAAAELR
jgi:hypothetical protein